MENNNVDRVLFFHSLSVYSRQLILLIQGVEEAINAGKAVYFVSCCGGLSYCFQNMEGTSGICTLCRFQEHSLLKQYKDRIKYIKIDISKYEQHKFKYDDCEELRNLVYRDTQIGVGILSTYISQTRNAFPEITEQRREFFDDILMETAKLTDFAFDVIEQVKPDKIVLFNGRFTPERTFFDIAQLKKIPIDTYEYTQGDNTHAYRLVTHNALPHNIDKFVEKMAKIWDVSPLSEAEKIRAGIVFYEQRRNGIPDFDVCFIANQERKLLPDDFDGTKRNIVIFNSSEDEYSSLGKEYSSYSLFDTQLDGIRYILGNSKDPNTHYYVRIHPNLNNIPYKYHTDYYALSRDFANVTIIPAGDKCDSYALLDAAEKVIVFGSTIGAEASYWGKAVILLTAASYYKSDICYIPANRRQLLQQINDVLAPKNTLNAIKYGYALLNDDLLKLPEYGKPMLIREYKIGKLSFGILEQMKLFNSCFLMAFLHTAISFTHRNFTRRHAVDPLVTGHRNRGISLKKIFPFFNKKLKSQCQ